MNFNVDMKHLAASGQASIWPRPPTTTTTGLHYCLIPVGGDQVEILFSSQWRSKKEKHGIPHKQSLKKKDGGRMMMKSMRCLCACVCVCMRMFLVCFQVQCLYVTPVCSAFGLEYLYVFTISPECLGKQTACLLMSVSVEYARCIQEREKRKG